MAVNEYEANAVYTLIFSFFRWFKDAIINEAVTIILYLQDFTRHHHFG